MRTYLASLRALIPPTLAGVLLLALISLRPAHRNWQRYEDVLRAEIEQGEVKYWGGGSIER